MKIVDIEIRNEPITETKQQFDARLGKWLKEIRLTEHGEESLEDIAAKTGITVDDIIRCESGNDIPHYEITKLVEYYNPDDCSCMIIEHKN